MGYVEIRSITGLRAIAALGVYCTHFGIPSWSPSWFKNIPLNGGFGVPFFFVLSGFVLTLAYENRQMLPKKYALDRFARIGPSYYLAFVLAIAYMSIPNGFEFNYVFVGHLFALQSWFPTMDSGVSFNGPAWTISVEMFLYAMFPILLRITSSTSRLFSKWTFVFLGGLLISLIPFSIHLYFLVPLEGLHNTQVWTYLLPTHYLGLFIVGMSGCMARIDIRNFLAKWNLNGLICDISIVLFGAALLRFNFRDANHPLLAMSTQFWLIGIPTVWVLVLLSTVSSNSVFSRIFQTRPFWFAGKISMVFYLVHVPTVWWVARIHPAARYETKLLVTVLLSVLVHLLIELPLNRKIRNWSFLHSKND